MERTGDLGAARHVKEGLLSQDGKVARQRRCTTQGRVQVGGGRRTSMVMGGLRELNGGATPYV
jgi:hypothetical protein